MTDDAHDGEDQELLRDVFAHFGHAAHWGQVLENTCAHVSVLAHRLLNKTTTPVELDKLELKAPKQTLGTLIKSVREKIRAVEPIEASVDTSLERRNFLTQHFFRERAEQIRTSDGKRAMIEELQQIQQAIFKANGMMVLTRKIIAMAIKHDEEHPPNTAKSQSCN